MCLILNQNRLEPIIAPYNIICYKNIYNDIAPIYEYHYIKNFLNPIVKIRIKKHYYSNEINEGYHSRNEKSLKTSNTILMIPAGTTFYIGGENMQGEDNYVSETIILLGKNNIFNRWYYKWKYKLKSYINDKTYQPI